MSLCAHLHTGVWAIHLMNVTTATLRVKCHTTSPPTKETKPPGEKTKKKKPKKKKKKKKREKKKADAIRHAI